MESRDGAQEPAEPRLPEAGGFSGDLREVAADYVRAVREELERCHWEGMGGCETAERFTTAIDQLVRFIVEVATIRFSRRYARAHQRCAVIAQGGYGRRAMSPWSDVDILVIYPGRITPYVETINERLIQTLFDARLQVGWAVRTVRDCLDQADRDLTVKTTLLDGRFVCGSKEIGAEFTEAVQDVLASRDVQGFIEEKLRETRERHRRLGGSVFLLEPDVKDGQGGLRDLHTLLWIGRVRRGMLSLKDLARSDVASAEEQWELLAAHEFLLRVRNGLHFLARYKQDKLSFENQEVLADRFGYENHGGATAVDLFMRHYYSHAAIIARTGTDIVARLIAPPEPSGLISRLGRRTVRDGVSILDSQLVVESGVLASDPVNLLRIFSDAQRNAARLSSATREAVRRNAYRLSPEVASSGAAVATFFSVLTWHEGVYRILGEMNRLGVLGRLIPEFGRLFCMVQHDFFHVYTVDEHSLIGIRELERLRSGEYAQESPLLTQMMRECDRPQLLFLAMMFHDLGKGYGGDHDERGAVLVRAISTRLGLHEDDASTLEFLVRKHLLMSKLAQNRDVDDVLLVTGFVREVGTLANLRYLYLLTFADMKAVGPKVWNGWKDHLLSELYLRAIDVLEKGAVTETDLEIRAQRARRRIAGRATAAAEQRRLEDFLATMPSSYFLSHTEDSVVDHWRLYESLGGSTFRAGVHHFRERGFTEFTVCAPDQPGLFVRITGVLSARGLNILGARIVTSRAGVAIDTYRIDHDGTEVDPFDPEVWAAVRGDIDEVLQGRVDVDRLVAEARRLRLPSSAVRKARRRVATMVNVDNEVSRDYTVIDLYAADRPGLLFTVAGCLYHLGLTIHLAKITTHVNQVLDVFYVADDGGGKILDRERLDNIRRVVLEGVKTGYENE